jgi:hypothetical protein
VVSASKSGALSLIASAIWASGLVMLESGWTEMTPSLRSDEYKPLPCGFKIAPSQSGGLMEKDIARLGVSIG